MTLLISLSVSHATVYFAVYLVTLVYKCMTFCTLGLVNLYHLFNCIYLFIQKTLLGFVQLRVIDFYCISLIWFVLQSCIQFICSIFNYII